MTMPAAASPMFGSTPFALAVRDRVLETRERGEALRIVGAGTWLQAGRPVAATAEVATRDSAGIVEYVPGDLTITVGAGTSLGDIATATRANGQWLALDPHGTDAGTIGATVATASAGPLANQFGTPRDVVLGVEFVSGTGAIVRAGGRVVKNVAGFDLSRLVTGAWGTLGVLTELTLRLRALPEVDRTLVVAVHDDAPSVEELRRWLVAQPFVPMAAELLNETAATAIGVGARGPALLLRLGGSRAAVQAQLDTAARLAPRVEDDSGSWRRLRASEPAGAVVVRLSDAPSRMATTWEAATRVASQWAGTLLHASVGRGIVRCILPRGGGSYEELERALGVRGVTRVFERLPGRLWQALAPSPAADRLSVGVRRAFDPDRLLNRGILGEPE